MRKVADFIPADAYVSAEQVLLQDVYRSRYIYIFPDIDKADYVFIDKKNPKYSYNLVEKPPDVFELLYAEDGISLYRQRHSESTNAQPYLKKI